MDNWVVGNLQNSIDTWNGKLNEIWTIVTQSPTEFRNGQIWNVIVNVHNGIQAIALALLVLFFVVGVMKTTTSFHDIKRPEHAIKLFIRFAIAKRLDLYTAIAPIPLSTFAGEPSSQVGKSFIKSYSAVCLEGAIIILACVIFSLFASSPPQVDTNVAPVTMVWKYIGELIFNMLVLVGTVKASHRVVREMMGV